MNHFNKIGFIMATLGSSIGLGHIWRFPYMAGENGGGAFVIFYLILAISIGVSMLIAEMLLGNIARSNPLDNYVILDKLNALPPSQNHNEHNAVDSKDKSAKKSLMWLGINAISGPIVLSFYAVVMGWILYYLIFVSFTLPQNIDEAKAVFDNLRSQSLWWQSLCFFGIVIFSAFIVSRGIKSGIERLNLVLMPLLFVIFIALLIYAMNLEEFSQSWHFMFAFEPHKIPFNTFVESLGQVFFSLSLGVGTIATYAANAQRNENLLKSSLWVVLSGIAISLIAGLMIFTFIYHFGGKPSEGVGLLLISLPLAFSSLGSSGAIIAALFFIAVLFAGLTSTISMLEPSVSILRDKYNFSQAKASYILSSGIFTLGFLVIMWNDASLSLPLIYGKSLFDILDLLTSSCLMPLGMLILLLFLGWHIKKSHLRVWTPYFSNALFYIWWWILRLIAPIIIIAILIS
nr:sodium-dependent transporter [uncultured Helicobacter sp.]